MSKSAEDMGAPFSPLSDRLRSIRVAFVGSSAHRWLARPVRSFLLDPSRMLPLEDVVGGSLDLIVIDPHLDRTWRGSLHRTIGEARALDAAVIGLQGRGDTSWSGLVDATIGSRPRSADLSLTPTVDPRVDRPRALERSDGFRMVVPADHRLKRKLVPRLAEQVVPWAESPTAEAVGWIPEPGYDQATDDIESWITDAVELSELVVLSSAEAFSSSWSRVAWALRFIARGAPVITVDEGDDFEGQIPKELAASMRQQLAHFNDPDHRQRIALQQRTFVMRRMSNWAQWDRLLQGTGIRSAPLPRISAILATKRPEFLADTVRQLQAQTYPAVEVVVVLHGDQWPQELPELDELGMATTIVRAGADHRFGEALNAGVAAASGELITKVDDDDWYGPDHLWDLVLAYEHAGATLVGKAAEWVYLQELDITIRRMTTPTDVNTNTIAGGAFVISREDLRSIGGFRRVSRHVDQALIADVVDARGVPFRTHGFGYVLQRHGGHTWDTDLDYFLGDASVQHRGLALWAAAAQ